MDIARNVGCSRATKGQHRQGKGVGGRIAAQNGQLAVGSFLNGGNLTHIGHGFFVGHQVRYGIEQSYDGFCINVGHNSGGVVVQAHADIHRQADINKVFQHRCLIGAEIGRHNNNDTIGVLFLSIARKLDGFFGVAMGYTKKRMNFAFAVAGHVFNDGLFFFNGQGCGFAG